MRIDVLPLKYFVPMMFRSISGSKIVCMYVTNEKIELF